MEESRTELDSPGHAPPGTVPAATEIGVGTDDAARELLRTCLCSRTRMLDRLLTRLYDDALAPLGLRANQLTTMALIASMNGLRAVDVGHLLEMDKSTVSRGLALLRERGWVDESESDTGRRRTLSLTSPGAAVLSEALPLWRSADAEAAELLGPTGAQALRSAANAFLARRARR